jgi:hypothetical protein
METITNLANTAVGTASKLIYGDQTTKTEDKTADAVETTKNNETAGKEPVSGVEGKGTATQPFDQGNARKSPNFLARCRRVGQEPPSATVAGSAIVGNLMLLRTSGPSKASTFPHWASFATQQHAAY